MSAEAQQQLFSLEQALELTGGNEEILARLLALLLRDLSEQRREIADLIAEKDWEQLRQLAHKLHGSAIYCATPALAEASNALEALLVENKLDGVNEASGQLIMEMLRLEEAGAAGELPTEV